MPRRANWLLPAAALVLGGCAVPQLQNTPVPERHEINPITRSGYYLYVPSAYRHERPWPLIVTCHGTPPFDTADRHVRELKWQAEQNGCLLVAPELIGTDGVLGDGPRLAMLENERRILSLISDLGYRYNIDRANIMITGFSGGGFPVYWVGLRHPDIFSVLALRNCNFNLGNLDGWYPPEAKGVPVLIYYGQNDPGAIAIQSRQAIEYLRSRGFTVTSTTVPGAGHERKPEVAMQFFLEHLRPPKPSLP